MKPPISAQLLLASFLCGPAAAAPENVRLEQRMGAAAATQATLIDETESPIALEHFQGKPVVLLPTVYKCSTLCNQVLHALLRASTALDWQPGTDYHIAVVSIDPRETPPLARERKTQYLHRAVGKDAWPGWHFLTGPRDSAAAITDSIGYYYDYDAQSDQYIHPAAIAILTPDGVVSRYLLGVDFTSADLKMALMEAADGRLGNFVDRVVLRCYRYDPARGRYGLAIMTTLRAGAALTLVALGGAIIYMHRKVKSLERQVAHDR